MTGLQTRLIDALDALGHCAADDERWACGARLLQGCGSEWITAGTAARSTGSALAIRSTTSQALMRDYMDQRLYLHDPWMRLCATRTEPDHLDVAAETRAPTRRDKARMSRLFADHGVHRAVLLPCYGGDRSGGIVLYARTPDAAEAFGRPETLAEARLLVAIFAAQYRPCDDRSPSADRYAAQNALTPRECEVLRWAYTGLRTSRIAERMGLQDVTVTKHLVSVRRKLKARTREQALAIAIRDGLIQV
jgi:DNA-binding CsgD family transcriptional regulator